MAIVLIAMLLRGYVCFRDVGQYSADHDAYRAISETLGNTGVFGLTASSGEARPTAFRPPLYPWVLSWFLIDGELPSGCVATLHTLLGCLTVLCTYNASRHLLGEMHAMRGSILAAILVLVDPVLLQQSTLVMTESMATAIASVVLWWWVRHCDGAPTIGSAAVLGLLLALAFLCRPTFLVWGLMLCICTAVAKTRTPSNANGRIERAALVAAASIAAILLVTVGGWALRNARAIGYPVWATTHGGYTLLLANNPMFYDYLRDRPADQTTWNADSFLLAYSHRYDGDPTTEAFWRTPRDSPGRIPVTITEHDDDKLAYEAAKATISREPGMFIWSCVVRAYRLWTPFPHRTGDRSPLAVVAIATYYIALYAAIALGLWRIGREILKPKWWPILSLVATLTLVHAVYWSNIRMRAPAIPSLAIIAAAALGQREERDS